MKNYILNQSILTLFVISLFGITIFFITKSHAANEASTSSVNEVVVHKNIATNKLNNISKDIRQYKNELDAATCNIRWTSSFRNSVMYTTNLPI